MRNVDINILPDQFCTGSAKLLFPLGVLVFYSQNVCFLAKEYMVSNTPQVSETLGGLHSFLARTICSPMHLYELPKTSETPLLLAFGHPESAS